MNEAEAPYEIREVGERVHVVWRGRWDEPAAESFASAMMNFLAQREDNPALVVDATRLQHCNILARGRLADLHEAMRPQIGRCVYVATSARMRGLCLWIIKVAGDERAKVLANDEDVEAWLNSDETRVSDAQRRILKHLDQAGKAAT